MTLPTSLGDADDTRREDATKSLRIAGQRDVDVRRLIGGDRRGDGLRLKGLERNPDARRADADVRDRGNAGVVGRGGPRRRIDRRFDGRSLHRRIKLVDDRRLERSSVR